MSRKMYQYTFINLGSVLCFLWACLIISGCASTDDVGRIRWELNALKSDINKIKKTSQSMETEIPGQKKQVDNKITELDEKQKSTAKTVSDLLIEVQKLTSEFQALNGRFEEARYVSEKNSTELLDNKEKLAAKIKELELAIAGLEKKLAESAAREAAVTAAEEAEKAKKAKEEVKVPEKAGSKEAQKYDVKDIYLSAYKAYKGGKGAEAREQFTKMLNDYPDNEYSDNARFWIAESFYEEKSYEDAILAYEELFKKNPKSDKIAGAMLKQGAAFYELNDKKTGNIVLEKLVEKFPNSEQAKLALKKMGKPVPQKKK
jgi:tol-pal system protein YbgF